MKTKPAPGFEMVDANIPEIQDNQVLVKVKATSLCGTDIHIYNWDTWAQGRIHVPQIVGHEFCGEVVEVGKNVKAIKSGDFVSAESHIPCGYCKQCLTGQMHICANLKILGVDRDGCFADYIAIPEVIAWKNPPDMPLEFASIQEPLGNAVYCTLVEPVIGKSVLIYGDGPAGLFSAAVARVAGAAPILLVGLSPERLAIARKLNLDYVIDASKDKVQDVVLNATRGIGADVVLEMAGSPTTTTEGLKLLRKGGRYSAFGLASEPFQFNLNDGVIFKGATLYGINGRLMYETWFTVSSLLQYKRLDVKPIITHKIPLNEFTKAFELMKERKSGKVLLFPDPKLISN